MFKFKQLRCSFCRKTENEVQKLVAGPRVFICDACVAIASRLMDGENEITAAQQKPSLWQKLTARILHVFRRDTGKPLELPQISI